MNETLPSSLPEEEPAPSKTGRGLALLALLLALLAVGGSGWMWWQNFSSSSEQEDRLAATAVGLEQQLSKLDSRVAAIESSVSGLQSSNPDARIKSIEQELASQRSAMSGWQSFENETAAWTHTMQAAIEGDQARLAGIEARLAALATREMKGSTELDLAEIDYVLRLAQERLQLFGDTRTAAQALNIADQQIAAFDNPLYLGLQREIASARQALLQAGTVDYVSVYRALDTLQDEIKSLPFKGSESPEATEASDDNAGWWARIKGVFSGLVTVRRQTAADEQLPVLADQELVRQKAWLELEVARLAALRHDQQAWSASLERFSSLLEKWFEPGAAGMQNVKSLLSETQALNIAPVLPDISAPWVALQAIRTAGVSAPPPAARKAESEPASESAGDEPGSTTPPSQPQPDPDTEAQTPEAGDAG